MSTYVVPGHVLCVLQKGEYNWDSTEQGLVLGSFYLGYIVTQLPGGWYAEKHGGKWLFGLGVLGTSMLSLLLPLSAMAGLPALVTLRILQGLAEREDKCRCGQGVTFPAMFVLLTRWIPVKQRSLQLALTLIGANLGVVIAMPTASALAEQGAGWPSVFYIFGVLGCVWFGAWTLLAFNQPLEHPYISQEELLYLHTSIVDLSTTPKKHPKVPWKAIFSSQPFWALLVTRWVSYWGLYLLISELPLYMTTVLRVSLRQNSLATSLIFSAQCLGMAAAGYLADYLKNNDIISLDSIRKSFEGIALLGSALSLVAIPNSHCEVPQVIALLIAFMTLYGFTAGGSSPTQMDIAPEFAGTITGLASTVGCSSGFLGPLFTGFMTDKKNVFQQTIEEWNFVFYTTAILYLGGAMCFIVAGTSDVQPWAKLRSHSHHILTDDGPETTTTTTTTTYRPLQDLVS
ncbi:SLC17A5 [Cordylochernes scorpioides]|uniref:SLC17A5 n=1 Tax=Cordylochernes scorpioides TaxID=51811 RepID=A0ABY6K0Q9_9ARAC|nr:SLC17A5 [Cordylochernes scorpioides]